MDSIDQAYQMLEAIKAELEFNPACWWTPPKRAAQAASGRWVL